MDAKRQSVILIVSIALLLGVSNPLFATDMTQISTPAWQALRDGKAVVLMRHALAPGMGDPVNFSINDCNTQRNLSDEGRLQAMNIGDLLRGRGIEHADVQSSQWCRCLETATLLDIGTVTASDTLNSFFQDRTSAISQTTSLQATIKKRLETPDKPLVMVTHQVNISALTRQHTNSGDILIVTIRNGQIVVLFRQPG